MNANSILALDLKNVSLGDLVTLRNKIDARLEEISQIVATVENAETPETVETVEKPQARHAAEEVNPEFEAGEIVTVVEAYKDGSLENFALIKPEYHIIAWMHTERRRGLVVDCHSMRFEDAEVYLTKLSMKLEK